MRNIKIITGIFLVIALAAGCSTIAVKPAAQNVVQNTTQTITGTLQSVSLSDKPDTLIVSIKTPTGTQNITVSKNTTVAVEGQACTLDDINLFDIQGKSYNCTAVYNPGCDADAIAFNVVKVVD